MFINALSDYHCVIHNTANCWQIIDHRSATVSDSDIKEQQSG